MSTWGTVGEIFAFVLEEAVLRVLGRFVDVRVVFFCCVRESASGFCWLRCILTLFSLFGTALEAVVVLLHATNCGVQHDWRAQVGFTSHKL